MDELIFDLNADSFSRTNFTPDNNLDVKTTNEKYRELFLEYHKRFNVSLRLENGTSIAKCYSLYPYKKIDVNHRTTIYIKKTQESHHSFSITYKEYVEIIKCFIKHLTLYLAKGFVYRFTSGIGIIRIHKIKPQKLGFNIAKTIKKVAKEQDISYNDAKTWIKNNRDKVVFEERTNVLLKGYKFKMFWFNKGSGVPFIYYWNLKITRSNTRDVGYPFFLDYYKNNPEAFNQIPMKQKVSEVKNIMGNEQ